MVNLKKQQVDCISVENILLILFIKQADCIIINRKTNNDILGPVNLHIKFTESFQTSFIILIKINLLSRKSSISCKKKFITRSYCC